MKFLVNLDDGYAEAYKLLAEKLKYPTRQALIKYILDVNLEQYPDIINTAKITALVKEEVREQKKPWNPPMRKLSEAEALEILGESAVPVVSSPELPEL